MKKNCKNHIILALMIGICAFSSLTNATIVKTKLGTQLDKVTPVPATAAQAYAKCTIDGGSMKAGPSIEKVTKELEALIKQSAVPYGMDDMKNMSEDEVNKIDTMSKEQKIAMAMKMAGTMMGGASQVKDTKLWGETIKLNNELAALGTNDTFTKQLTEATQKADAAHEKITEETTAAIKTCPNISTGEMSGPDPACVKAKKLAGADKHITAEAKRLADIKAVLTGQIARIKPLIARGDQILEKGIYGEALDPQSKTITSQMQGLALNQIMLIQIQAESAYVEAAKWIQAKKDIEKN